MIAMHVSMFTGTVRTHSKLLMTTVVHETKRGMSSSAQLSENAIFVCQVVGVTIEKPFFKYMRAIVNLSFIYRFSGRRRVDHIQFFPLYSLFLLTKSIVIVFELSFILKVPHQAPCTT